MGKFAFEIETKISGNNIYKLIVEIGKSSLFCKSKNESLEYTVNDILKPNAKIKVIKIKRPAKVKTLKEWKVHIGNHVLFQNIKPYSLPEYVYNYWKENMFLDDEDE